MCSDAPGTTFLHYVQHLVTMSFQQAQFSSFSNEKPADSDAEERWKQALEKYREETGRDLLQHSFATDIQSQSSIDGVMEQFANFKNFRSRGRKVLRVLKPIVSVVIRFIDAGAEAGSVRIASVSHCGLYLTSEQKVAPGGKAIFVAVGALLQVSRRSVSA